MAKTLVEIRGIDPLLFRDGKPFSADSGGLTASSLPLPFPTTVAAFLRTQLGGTGKQDWTHDECTWAHGIPVHGPLLVRDGEVVFPAPLDALLTEKADVIPLRPSAEDAACCDLPDGMWPLTPKQTPPDGKPPKGYAYWPLCKMLKWLEGEAPKSLVKISGLPMEERIGIEIDAKCGKATDGKLYATRLRGFEEKGHQYSLVARVGLPDGQIPEPVGALGGERRLTVVETLPDTPEAPWPRCPETLKTKLASATRVRMVLATPAYFTQGWKPDWIEKSGSGEAHFPTGIANVGLKLVAAAVGRRVAVSGWSARESKPREIRWLVPAGSVFFFEVTGGDPKALYEKAWMKPVSDGEQNRRDGLGLALWGTW